MNHYAAGVDEAEKDIKDLKIGNPEGASYMEARVDTAGGVGSDKQREVCAPAAE